ncbi:MAG TPA: glycosyltransferase family 4 protein [Candidatus Binatia bacterium]|nr:glycosyltransferase family 4 protein [Candidatus Binatia bacterium]
MKIALVHKRFDLRGGTEQVLYRTAEGLRDRGHEVHLFCGEFLIQPPAGVFKHRVPSFRWPRTARLLSFAVAGPKMVERYRCDVVLSFDRILRQDIFRSGGGPHLSFIKKMMAQSPMSRRIWYKISPYHRCVLAIEKRQTAATGHRRIIAISMAGKREFMEEYGVPENKIVVVYNGVDVERFHPRNRARYGNKTRASLGIPTMSQVVLFVGTGFRRKGVGRLLQMWTEQGGPDAYLLIVGNDAKLSYYRKVWNHSRIRFAGPQTRIEDFYAAADLLVLPSVQEAFGNVVLEALASGVPVVTSAAVGAAESLCGELRGGLVGDREGPEGLKQKIFWALDPERRPVLSQMAREIAEKHTWDRYFNQLEEQFHELRSQSEAWNKPEFGAACCETEPSEQSTETLAAAPRRATWISKFKIKKLIFGFFAGLCAG